MRLYRRVVKKDYLHGKAVYRYERFYIPVPRRYHDLVRPFLGVELNIQVEPAEDGFTVRVSKAETRETVSA